MKKFIVSALAAGALAAGGAASAQDFGSVIGSLLNLAIPGMTQQYGTGQMYQDQYGRQFYYDQYGRQVYVQQQTNPYYGSQYGQYGQYGSQYGSQTIIGYDSWGRPIYGSSYGGYTGRAWDSDGDGVANSRDRWPSDPRYW